MTMSGLETKKRMGSKKNRVTSETDSPTVHEDSRNTQLLTSRTLAQRNITSNPYSNEAVGR